MPKGGTRKGAGRKPKNSEPLITKGFSLEPRVKAAFELAFDFWHTETDGTQGEFLTLILFESERVKGLGG